jgi:hypothetical protein
MQEVRAFPRKRRRFQVRYTDEKRVSRVGFTHDVSNEGAFVTAASLPSVGQTLDFELDSRAGKNIQFTGRVVRQRRTPAALSTTSPSGFGLRLIGAFEDYQQFVSAL